MVAEGSGFEKYIRYACSLICIAVTVTPIMKISFETPKLPDVPVVSYDAVNTVTDLAEEKAKADKARQNAETAKKEGFPEIASSFEQIAKIEKTHGDRFGKFADLLEQGKLFVANAETKWMCLNCGHIHTGERVPPVCPVCQHDQGYFVRLSLAPWEQ